MVGGKRVDYGAYVSVYEVFQIIAGEVDTVVGDSPLGIIIGADALGTVAGADLAFARLRLPGVLLLHHRVQEPCLQHLQGLGLVLAVDRILDMFRTTINVYGDTCAAVIIAKSEGEELNI